jgi:hypothetical protein
MKLNIENQHCLCTCKDGLFRDNCQGSLTEVDGYSTVDLRVLNRLGQLLFVLKILYIFFTKQAPSIRRLTVVRVSPYLEFPVTAVI